MPFNVPPPLRALASPHRAVLERVFGPIRPEPLPPGEGEKFLFLCFTNRCGSNHLAQLLASTGAFNEAGEFFNAETVLEHSAPRGLRSLTAYFATLTAILPHFGPLAMKTSPDQLAMLADAGVLDAIAPRATFLLLERADRLGQALSRVIATQTGRFFAHQTAAVPDAALVYSRAAIDAELERIALGNALFYAFFAANGVVPLHTTHEEVLKDPAPLLRRLETALGVAIPPPDPARITIERQAGPVNAAWRREYMSGK